MKSSKYLIKNIGLLTISQFGTKIMVFFLVPLYTSVLSTSEYGIYDLCFSAVSLLIPILTLNISNASLRFALDKDKNKSHIFSISILFVIKGIMILGLILLLNHLLKIFTFFDKYSIFLLIMFATNSLNETLSFFARGIEKVKEIAISGVICSAFMLVCNIVFLLPLHMGLTGYFLANIIGAMVQVIYLFIAIDVRKFWNNKIKDNTLKNEMLNYCMPLIANNISWWINNVSDRYIVTFICGIAANGIYSIGYKIPSILNIFQTVFSQAWTISAVKDFDKDDKNNFFTNSYNMYNFCMITVCSILIIMTRILAYFLYLNEFFLAWKYVPFLLIAIIFGAISGYLGGIFAAVKDSKVFAKTTVIGAVTNIILNIILVKIYGPIGAAISTTISYWLTWLLRIISVKKYIKLKLDLKRDNLAYVILIIQSIILLRNENETIYLYLIEILLFIIVMLLYNKQLKSIIMLVKSKILN